MGCLRYIYQLHILKNEREMFNVGVSILKSEIVKKKLPCIVGTV